MKRYLVALIILTGVVANAQTSITLTLQETTSHPASRIGLNIGAQDYYQGYLTKNLIKVNPSMQNIIYRQVKTCASGSATTCVTTNDYDSKPANYDTTSTGTLLCKGGTGASPGTCGTAGQAITYTANTANNTGTGSTTYTFNTLSGSAVVAANDSISIISSETLATRTAEFTWNDFGWQPNLSGTGTSTIDTTSGDLPATLAGFANAVQVVELKTTAGSSSAGVYTFFDTAALRYLFNGAYHFCVNVKIKSGTPGAITLSVARPSGVNVSPTITPTGTSDTNYCATFTASETTSTPAGNVQIGIQMSPTAAADVVIYNATLTADADTSTTAYTNSFLTNISATNPGELRYNADGLEGTSLQNLITPAAYRKMSNVLGGYAGAEPVQQGLYEFLVMAETVGIKKIFFDGPPTWSPTDYANLTQFLGGAGGGTCSAATMAAGTTDWGQCRIQLGHTAPFTSVFTKAIVEPCNECWNTTLNTGQSSYPQYSVSATAYWNYTHLAIQQCAAIKASASYSSVISCVASTQTALGSQQGGYVCNADTGNAIDALSANEYGQFTVTSCGIPGQYTSAAVEAYANTLTGSASGFYQTKAAAAACSRSMVVYEYNNSTNAGSCTQAQINGYPEGMFYGIVNTLMPLLSQKTLGITDQNIWQMYQPSQGLTTSGGATSINEWGIFTGSGGAYNNQRGTALAMGVVNNAIAAATVGYEPTLSTTPTFNFTSANGVNTTSNVPYIYSTEYINGSTRSLVIHNIDLSNAYTVNLAGTNTPTGSVSKVTYTSTNVNDACEGANASPCSFVTTATTSGTSYTVPSKSITTLSWTAGAPETINWLAPTSAAPSGGFTLIPNQQFTFFVAQANYSTVGANFTITGGTILSALNGAVTIQAPSSGSTCSYDASNKVTASSTNVAITATPKDGGAAAVTLTVPVCSPTPTHNNLPTFRMGVYVSQPVILQCIVEQTMNKACTWAITTNPGSAGSLADTNQRDTVFTATAPGRYVVTSTAAVDSSTQTTVIDIPDNTAMPYQVTSNGTAPVNCANDSNLTGTIYNVGPGQTYTDLTAFFTAITPAAGDQIHIANQTVGSGTPTTLFNYVVVASLGTQTQPIFFCGVPNAAGYLPALDGTNATSSYPANQFFTGYGLFNVYLNSFSTSPTYPQFIQLSGFTLQNASNNQLYLATGSGHTTTNTWGSLPVAGNGSNNQCATGATNCPAFVSAVRIQDGGDINIIGNEFNNIGQAVFTEAKVPISLMSWRVLIEGNYIHNFGYATPTTPSGVTGGIHAIYVQSYLEAIQGNNFGPAASTAAGGVYKDRGVVQFFRYNYLNNGSDTTSRNIDLVDQQDACYTNSVQFINCAGAGTPTPDPGFSWDQIAGWSEAFNDESWVYGNVHASTALGPVHYNGDHGTSTSAPRQGILKYFNNTLICPNGCKAYDTDDPNTPIYSFPTINTQNSIFWMNGAVAANAPGISYLRNRAGMLNAVSLITPTGATTNLQASTNTFTPWTGWPGMDTTIKPLYYADYNTLSAHISGFGTSGSAVPNTQSSQPYNSITYATNSTAGTVLPSSYPPVRFMFRPDLGYVITRNTVVSTTSAGIVGAVDAAATAGGSAISGGLKLAGGVVIH